MMVDTMVYGYVGDGAVYHPHCIRDEEREEYAAETGTVMGRLYSHEDDGEGLECDTCGLYIFEPDEDEEDDDDA